MIALLYCASYLVCYIISPLGRVPQLDAAENLTLATKIAAGTLPHEPFYRAMLYPGVLAGMLKLGVSTEQLPAYAALLGFLCHGAVGVAVMKLALRLWVGTRKRNTIPVLVSAGLWLVNPVALYYSINVLDVVPALALFMWGLVWWTRAEGRKRDAVIGGIFMGLAVAARPHFLPVVVVAPWARAWLAGRWRPRIVDAWTWVGAGVVLVILGIGQWQWSGEFRIMPWQGSYNFYAANKPGANGKYYTQQVYMEDLPAGINPAQAESEFLYAKATGKTPPFDPGEMEKYWRQQAWSEIGANPGAWLKLMVKKAYYLFNDYDQYNNFTYAWEKAQSPVLAWNFLGWGIVLILAVATAAAAWGRADPAGRARLAGYFLIFAAYGGGVLLYYASGRFRLPLLPLMCVVAGSIEVIAERPAAGGKRGWGIAMVAALVAVMLTFSNFFNAHDDSTIIQDEVLTANAASSLGDDRQAYALAEEGLQRDATRPDLKRIAIISYFNLTLADGEKYDTVAGWQKVLTEMQDLQVRDATLALVTGVACWKTGNTAQAEKIWQVGAARYGPDSAPAKAGAAAQKIEGAITPNSPPPDPAMVEYLARKAR
jgi:4-amino-4-deoxy-L-arabinose transferase-like glycosyltransferase